MTPPIPPNKTTVTRLFSQVAKSENKQEPQPLSTFFTKSAVVVLGEPGMGKTTCFEQAAKEERNAVYLPIRTLLRKSDLSQFSGKTLYLDGFDEQRTGNENGNKVLDEIIKCLENLNKPKFRLSCRTMDWYGELDRSNLCDASATSNVLVLRLESLSQEQVQCIVEAQNIDGKEFSKKARQSGIADWVNNPQHLNYILNVINKGEAWPTTRKELFERSCRKLVVEHNQTHQKQANQPPVPDQLILAAGLLCVIIIRANLAGVALNGSDTEDEFPALSTFSEAKLPLLDAARTKLFCNPSHEKAAYHHRTMAEFLAACFLVDRIKNGLPAERVRCLLTTQSGQVSSNLRGLHAWVTTLCPDQHISLFIRTDPMGLILYGDPASISSRRKIELLEALSVLAVKDPWFRNGHQESHHLGRLSDPSLKDHCEKILSQWQDHSKHMLYTILDINHHGKTPIISQDILLHLIKQQKVPSELRTYTVEIFIRHHQESLEKLLPVLCDLNKHNMPNDDQEFRAVLLNALYPSKLKENQLIEHLAPQHGSFYGRYFIFLMHGLVEQTPPDRLPHLMNTLSLNKQQFKEILKNDRLWQEFLDTALAKTLEKHGEQLSTDKLYEWINIATSLQSVHWYSQNSQKKHACLVKKWFNTRQNITKKLFITWIKHNPINNANNNIMIFWQRLRRPNPPDWFPDWCLELAAKNSNDNNSKVLFKIGINSLLHQPPKPPYPLERAFSFVEKYHTFELLLKPYLVCPIGEKYWEAIQEINQPDNNKDLQKRKNINQLNNRLDGIRAGTDHGAILYLSKIYYGHSSDVNQNTQPIKRLREHTTPEIAQVAEEGFVNYVKSASVISPQEIGELLVKNKCHTPGWGIMAGIDLITHLHEKPLDTLPESTLESALCFHLSNNRNNNNPNPEWFTEIIYNRHELATRAFFPFWKVQLQAGNEHVHVIHHLVNEEEDWSEVAKRVALPLLQECPNLKGQDLHDLLFTAFRWGNHEELKKFVSTHNNPPNEKISEWSWWVATKYILEQTAWSDICSTIEKNQDYVAPFILFIDKLINIKFSISTIQDIVATIAKLYQPTTRLNSNGEMTNSMFISEYLNAWINRLGQNTSREASNALHSLANNANIPKWHDKILHTLATRRQIITDHSFANLSAQEVLHVINNSSPATTGDLQTIVVDHIRTIAKELRDGKSNGYKAFWNLDKHSRPTTPIPENDGRDRLLDRLNQRLSPMNINVEAESHVADTNRADIGVIFNNWFLPIEIKRDSHNQLWKAIENQLIAKYMRDPRTEEYGIYLVFWYGEKLQAPPQEIGLNTPATHQELEDLLQNNIPPKHDTKIKVIVMDVSTHKTKTTDQS